MVVEPFALQVVELQVEFCLQLCVGGFVEEFAREHGSVEGAYDVEVDGFCFWGEECEVYAVVFAFHFVYFEQVHDDSVEYGAFSHSVHAAQDVYVGVEVPADVFVSVPECVYLDAFNVLCVHLFYFMIYGFTDFIFKDFIFKDLYPLSVVCCQLSVVQGALLCAEVCCPLSKARF